MSSNNRGAADHDETSPLLRAQEQRSSSYSQSHNVRTTSHSHDHSEQTTTRTDDEDREVQDTNAEVAVAEEPSTTKLVFIMGATWIGTFFAALDQTVVATLTAPISSEFDSLSLLSWLATGYLIANAACQPLSGKLTDIFSRRWGLLFSNFFFAIGTLICGIAPNAPTIIAGRVIAGIGGGGLTCIATFITSDLIPLRRRGVWQGYGNIVFGSGMALGGLFGGVCADKLNWRWAFYLQLPFILVSSVMVFFLVDIPVNPSKKPALSRIDFLGSTLLVASLVLLLFGLNTGGNQLPWNSPLVIASIVAAVVVFAIFLYVESSPNIVPEPVIPVTLVRKTRTVFAACLTNWFSTMTVFLSLYYLPLFLQSVQHKSSTSAGLRSIPHAVGLSTGSLGIGFIMRQTGQYYMLYVVAMVLLLIGQALLVSLQTDSPGWTTFLYVTPIGLGYGGMLTVTLVAMISAVDHQYQAVITAASYAFRSTGSTIGITIASAVYQNVLTTGLVAEYGDKPDAEKIIQRIKNSLDAIKHLPSDWKVDVIEGVYMDAFRATFATGLGLAVLATLCGAFMKQHTLHSNLSRK